MGLSQMIFDLQLQVLVFLVGLGNMACPQPGDEQLPNQRWSRPPTPFASLRHNQLMMTSSNGNIFRVTGPLCGEFTGPGEFPTQRPVTRGFDVFFDLRLNKRLSKQPWGWWFETPSWSLWRQCNVIFPWTKWPSFCRRHLQTHFLK